MNLENRYKKALEDIIQWLDVDCRQAGFVIKPHVDSTILMAKIALDPELEKQIAETEVKLKELGIM